MLISPRTTFHSCGSSSRLVRRRKRPSLVTCVLPSITSQSGSTLCSISSSSLRPAFGTILRNLRRLKCLPSFPTLVCPFQVLRSWSHSSRGGRPWATSCRGRWQWSTRDGDQEQDRSVRSAWRHSGTCPSNNETLEMQLRTHSASSVQSFQKGIGEHVNIAGNIARCMYPLVILSEYHLNIVYSLASTRSPLLL